MSPAALPAVVVSFAPSCATPVSRSKSARSCTKGSTCSAESDCSRLKVAGAWRASSLALPRTWPPYRAAPNGCSVRTPSLATARPSMSVRVRPLTLIVPARKDASRSSPSSQSNASSTSSAAGALADSSGSGGR